MLANVHRLQPPGPGLYAAHDTPAAVLPYRLLMPACLLSACRFAEEADRLALALGGRFTHRVVPLECDAGAALAGSDDDTIRGRQEAVAAAAR